MSFPLLTSSPTSISTHLLPPSSTERSPAGELRKRGKFSVEKMIKLRSKRFGRSSSSSTSKLGGGGGGGSAAAVGCGEIKWELRPGGMLVQKRENGSSSEGEMITVRVFTGSRWHDISIEATSTFGELKMILSLVTGLEPREQRLLYRGKEREDRDYLHMEGVKDMEKVLLFEDPAYKERKLLGGLSRNQTIAQPCPTISV